MQQARLPPEHGDAVHGVHLTHVTIPAAVASPTPLLPFAQEIVTGERPQRGYLRLPRVLEECPRVGAYHPNATACILLCGFLGCAECDGVKAGPMWVDGKVRDPGLGQEDEFAGPIEMSWSGGGGGWGGVWGGGGGCSTPAMLAERLCAGRWASSSPLLLAYRRS